MMKMKNKNLLIISLSFFVMIYFVSCGDSGDYVPKPQGYLRLDLPQKKYLVFDSTYPYTFEYPIYAKVSTDKERLSEPFWINIEFPKFKGKINISYKKINHNLTKYADDAYKLAMKHISKASNIEDERINVKEHNVYGIVYNIEGEGTASAYQFFISDSTSNFVRGALYFNIKPNNDSLAPVIDFIKQDIQHLIKTFKWKKDYSLGGK